LNVCYGVARSLGRSGHFAAASPVTRASETFTPMQNSIPAKKRNKADRPGRYREGTEKNDFEIEGASNFDSVAFR
jgi:hypothetical protein